MAGEGYQDDHHGYGREYRDNEPPEDPSAHGGMLHAEVECGKAWPAGSDAAAAGDELLDGVVVLQEVVELDDIVDRESRAARK
jgi:hypothetical protein